MDFFFGVIYKVLSVRSVSVILFKATHVLCNLSFDLEILSWSLLPNISRESFIHMWGLGEKNLLRLTEP